MLVEFAAMELIEAFGDGAVDEACRRRNAAWRERDFDAADRWSAIALFVERIERSG